MVSEKLHVLRFRIEEEVDEVDFVTLLPAGLQRFTEDTLTLTARRSSTAFLMIASSTKNGNFCSESCAIRT